MSHPDSESIPGGLEVAIIGMAGRFPGARDVGAFWRNLCQGVESITVFSEPELEAAGVPAAHLDNPAYVRAGAILDDVEWFDPAFFGINPREAEYMDPQQRFFLECAWEALENAGYNPDTYPGAIGLFGGAHLSTYLTSNLAARAGLANDFQVALCNDKDFLTTRVSYKLNLRGPSVNVNTACSTSLVAVHVACQNLIGGACDLALAGGVTITVPQQAGYFYQEGGITSPDGHCRAFDARAQGTVGGSGVGVVVLKRLDDALADRDHIYAIVKGSAVNNDGALKVGFTAPSVEGQARVIRAAQIAADTPPETITYVEAHGTGTPLGDPIEVAALTQAFQDETSAKAFCAIGTLKTNIGHLDAAAGVAGLIKTALALHHRQIPPSLHFERPNPAIDFDNSPFYVNARLADWPDGEAPRRAGVSSFGIGGTNAHVILEEALPAEPGGPSRPWQLFVLSARSEPALKAMTANLTAYLKQHPELPPGDVAHTLRVGRKAFAHRRAVVSRDLDGAVQALESLAPGQVLTGSAPVEKRPLVFMFPGQGAQYVNMGRELYQSEPDFRQPLDLCAELLRSPLGFDLRSVLYPESPDAMAGAVHRLQQTALTQPALFAIDYALARLWMAWGLRPRAMIGHSLGEYVAACLAGVFSLEEALDLVAARGHLMQQLPEGAMLAVSLSEAALGPYLGDALSLAVVNAPERCVVAGPPEAVRDLERRLAQENIFCRRLPASHAFHSAMMDPILDSFADRVRRTTLRAPQIPFVSNVTGRWITAAEATDPGYWVRHLRQTVRFADGLHTLAQEPQRVLLEVGPGQALCALARQQPEGAPDPAPFATLRRADDPQPDQAFLLKTLGGLWMAGTSVNWEAVDAGERPRRVPLPSYPFERQRCWIEPEPPAATLSNVFQGLEAIPPGAAGPALVEQVIEQQLRLMAQQLDAFASGA